MHSKKLNAGISKKGNIDFIIWTTGISIFGILIIMLYKIFDSSYEVLDLAMAGIVFHFCQKWRKKKLLQIEKK